MGQKTMAHGRLTHLLLAAMQNLFCWAMSMQQTLQLPQMTARFTSFGTHQCHILTICRTKSTGALSYASMA